jgi:deoxyribodipyrimidine photolyase-related protein
MSAATIVYPHQLFAKHPAIAKGRPIFLIEEPLFMSEFPTHRQKLLLHRLSMQAYEKQLRDQGYPVTTLPLTSERTTDGIFAWLSEHHFTEVHIVDTTDDWLESRIAASCATHRLTRITYESPLFLLRKQEAMDRYRASKRHMARFYEQLRRDTGILMTDGAKPVGGQFSFDAENRKRVPRDVVPPADPVFYENDDTTSALAWLDTIPGEHYGEAKVWLPYTHKAARGWLEVFVTERFADFGPYEDAIDTESTLLWHSALSPLLNIGLITPQEIIDTALAQAEIANIPLPSLEGFVRQIIGWREFIRAAYEAEGLAMRKQNFWQHNRKLPETYWTGTTTITPVDDSIKKALSYGYTHHIERLMVLGNFMLLSEIHPDEVYKWFMAMYADAYDWVMVPNVYGMSQFADGGSFATKPYISGSNYIRKMSDYKTGAWSEIWDALYWHFIAKHKEFFLSNHRLSMMPRLLEKMSIETKFRHLTQAKNFLANLL